MTTLLEAAKVVLELYDKQGYIDTATKSYMPMANLRRAILEEEALDQMVQNAQNRGEYT